MRSIRTATAVVATALCLAVIGARAQQEAQNDIRGSVKAAGLRYYLGTVFGDAPGYLKVARMPLYVIRDGTIASRDEKETRKLLAGIAERNQKANLSDDDRKRMTANMIAVIEESGIEFIGANTASLTFLLRRGENDRGDSLISLVLHRSDGKWQVIEEITDSGAVPPAYIK